MPPPHVTPLLPSGKQMQELDLPAAVVEQVEMLAMQILQRSLGPIVQRRRGRLARQELLRHLLETAYHFTDLETAVERAFHYTSALGQCMPGLDEEELARMLKYKAAASSGSGLGSTSKLLSGVMAGDVSSPSTIHDGGADDDGDDAHDTQNRSQTRAPASGDDGEGSDGEMPEAPLAGTTPLTRPPRTTPPPISPDKVAASAAAALLPRARAASTAGPLVDVESVAAVREALRELIASRATFTAYLEGEKIQWAREPAAQVLVLVAGAVLRAAPHPPVAESRAMTTTTGAATAAMTTMTRSRLASVPFSPAAGVGAPHGRRESGRLGAGSGLSGLASGSVAAGDSAESGRRPSSALDAQVRLMMGGGASSNANTNAAATEDASDALSHSRRTSTVLQGFAAAVAASQLGELAEEVLEAPLVLGEAACLGGFPVCADLVVHTPVAIMATMSKRDYMALLESAPRTVQQQLLSLALQERERLLPYYAPMTLARLRLCPLLHNLRRDQLEVLLDAVQPRVFPANAACSERSDPQHIFFVRRGAVRLEREQGEPSSLTAQSYLQTPRSRALLFDGHTYGEASCIFREGLGGTFFAINHVDVYQLPFAALIHLMKQFPDAQTKIYDAARLLTAAREREVPGFLFRPPDGAAADGTVTGLAGLIPSSSVLFRRGSTAAQRSATAAAHQQQQHDLLQHHASLSLSGAGDPTRCVSFAVDTSTSGPLAALLDPTMDAAAAAAGGDANLSFSGGERLGASQPFAAGAAMVEAMRRIPLLNVVGTTAFFNELAPCWRPRRVEKGDFLVRRGEECNRLLLLCRGRAAVIVDEQRYAHDLRCCPFGIPDVDSISTAALAFIPAGFATGYTCTRRHRWTRSVVALDDGVEVLEVTRGVLVQLLQHHHLERALGGAALQVMQPLACVFSLATSTQGSASRPSTARPASGSRPSTANGVPPMPPSSRQGSIYASGAGSGLAISATAAGEMSCPRSMALDYQPLLHPSPNSLWACHPVPNLHPVVTADFTGPVRDRVLFPLWKDGDFPLPRVSTTHGGGEDGGMYSSDQSMVGGSRPLSRRATRSNLLVSSSDASPLVTPGASMTGAVHRLNSGAFELAMGSAAGSGASSPLAPAALARAEFQRRMQQEGL